MAAKIILAIFMLCIFTWLVQATTNCTSAGYFADSDDTTCKRYTVCTYSNGTYSSSNRTCGSKKVFNPNTSKCVSNTSYVCNVTTASSTANSTTNSTTSSTNSTDNSTATTTTDNSTTSSSDNSTTSSTANSTATSTDNSTTSSTGNSTTSSTTNSTTDSTANSTTSDSTNSTSAGNTTTSVCTKDGFIADPSSTNCSSYIECIEINGTFTETYYTCPDSYYDPNTTLCVTDYNCTTTTTFTCTAAGRFADTSDTSCQKYYFCVLLSTGNYTQYNYTCPSTSVFNPTSKVCTTSYTCTTA